MKQYSFLFENIDSSDDEEERRKKVKEYKSKKRAGIAGAILGTAVGSYAPSLAAQPLLKNLATKSDDIASLDYLNGVKVNGQDLKDYAAANNLKIGNNVTGNSYYIPSTHSIEMGISKKGADKYGKSIFAHELGHSVSMGKSGFKQFTYKAGKTVTGATALGQIINCFNTDDESRKKIGWALNAGGIIGGIPVVAEEINASILGTQMLGLTGEERTNAFMGIGSYITLALSPTIIYGVSEGTRKILKLLRNLKNEKAEIRENLDNLKKQDEKVKIK